MTGILISIVLGLLVNECCDVSPWCARKLVQWSANQRYTDPARAAERAEELAALIDERPGKLLKLFTALGFAGSAILVTWKRELVSRRSPETLREWSPLDIPVAVIRDNWMVVGDVPQQPSGFQPRTELLAALDAAGPGVSVVHAVTGMRGVGKTQLAAAYARAKVAERWPLVAWVNAEGPASLAAGLAAVAKAAGLAGEGGVDLGLAVRHWLEADGDQRLVVFDNATDPDVLRPYLPATGAARVLVTSNRSSAAALGEPVGVEVFTPDEAAAFLAARTGLADPAGARELAAELGFLPLALAQAAAVIRGKRLDYATYLNRLRELPVAGYLTRQEGQPYPHGVAEAVLLSLETVRTADRSGVAVAVLDLLAVLSPSGVRRSMLHTAGQYGVLGRGELTADVVDQALGRLAEASLLTFSVDCTSVTAHRLVMRVIREQMSARGALAGTCATAGKFLNRLARLRDQSWHEDRAAVQDLVEQIMALHSASAVCRDDANVARLLSRLRWWATRFLNLLSDSTN